MIAGAKNKAAIAAPLMYSAISHHPFAAGYLRVTKDLTHSSSSQIWILQPLPNFARAFLTAAVNDVAAPPAQYAPWSLLAEMMYFASILMLLGVWGNKVILFKRIPWDTTPEQARRWTKERCRIQSAGFCACRYRKLLYRLIRAIRWFLTPAWCVSRVSRMLFERLTAGGRRCFLLRWVYITTVINTCKPFCV